jgi:hypothetical protein
MFEYQGWKFDTIESIPYPEENFEIIKVTGLRNKDANAYDIKINEPAFMMQANAHLWHFVQEGLAQYEVISKKFTLVKLFFHDYHLEGINKTFIPIQEYSNIKSQYSPYIKDLASIYSHDKKIYLTNKSSILIKEAYFINDISRLLDRNLILTGDVIPYWIKATDDEGKWISTEDVKRASPYFHEDCIYDRWQIEGLKLVKNRLYKYMKKDEIFHTKIYISREDVNKMWSSLAPSRSYNQEQTLIDYFISQGYNKVVLTDYGYIDQINILFNATHVAGLTGSGLFNTFLCRPGTTVIEIHVSANYYWSYEYFKEFGLNIKTAELRWRKDFDAVLSNKTMSKLKELVEQND